MEQAWMWPSRIEVRHLGDETQVTLPRWPPPFLIMLIFISTLFWIVQSDPAAVRVFDAFGQHQLRPGMVSLWRWGGGALGIVFLYWAIVLSERITLTPDVLRVQLVFGPFTWSRTYPVSAIRRLRVQAIVESGRRGRQVRGELVFDLGGRTVVFARRSSEADAIRVRQVLGQQAPQLSE